MLKSVVAPSGPKAPAYSTESKASSHSASDGSSSIRPSIRRMPLTPSANGPSAATDWFDSPPPEAMNTVPSSAIPKPLGPIEMTRLSLVEGLNSRNEGRPS